MDTTSLRTLNAITPLHTHLRSRASLFGPLSFSHFKNNFSFSLPLSSSSFRFSPVCSLPEKENGGSLPRGAGEAVNGVSPKKFLQVVLVSPQIPGNTGCIARTCAASACGLHLVGVEIYPVLIFIKIFFFSFVNIVRIATSSDHLTCFQPLGFQVDDTKLKRAGLDYWPYVVVKVHSSWAEFRDYFSQQEGEKRLLAFTKRGTATHSEISYRKGDYLIFGSETTGLPPEALQDCKNGTFGGGTIRIPMVETYVRCLNLSVSAGIAVYEAARQLDYEQLKIPSEICIDREQPFITDDIFA